MAPGGGSTASFHKVNYDYSFCSICWKEYQTPEPFSGMCCGKEVIDGRLPFQAGAKVESAVVVPEVPPKFGLPVPLEISHPPVVSSFRPQWNRLDLRGAKAAPQVAMVTPPAPDISKAVIKTADALNDALRQYWEIGRSLGGGQKVKLTLCFPPVQNMEELQSRILGMGVAIVQGGRTGIVESAVPPYAFPHGDERNPGYTVVYKLLPAEERMTFELRTRKRVLELKVHKFIIESRLEMILGFFGAPLQVSGPAPAKAAAKSGGDTREPGAFSFRDSLAGGAA
jgi:hypothetical protein